MATQQFTVEDDRYRDEPPVRSTNWLKGCLLGCLAVVVVLLVLGTLATIWVTRNWRSLFSSGATKVVHQAIDATELPAEEKQQIKVEIDRFFAEFGEGRVSTDQMQQIVEKFAESPLLTALVASAVETKYLDKSALSDEEKAEARVTLQRFIRGAMDSKIDEPSMEAALRHLADKQPDGNWKFREQVTDEQMRAFLADAKKAADDAQVPEQPEHFDPSDEVKRIIDEVMAGEGADAAPPLEGPPLPETPPEAEAKD
jgi:hypothetical protein